MRRTGTLLALTLAAALSACADQTTPLTPLGAVASMAPQANGPTASARWNATARSLVAKHNANAFQAVRGYAILGLAQYEAVVAAEKDVGEGPRASERAAVSRASAVVLSYLFPDEATALDAMVADFEQDALPGEDVSAGEAAGRDAAAQVVARARTDNFFVPWSGTVPTGPGLWFSTANPPAPPIGVLFGRATPFLLCSGDQFRAPPPPAFGSPEFLAALAEVRQISDTRTPAQLASARFWAFPTGTYGPAGYWSEQATQLAESHRLGERATAHLLALANMAGFDAIIATHDTKYTYWFIRPSQADPAITLPIGLPNFPSYTSNHAALSAAMAAIIGSVFPEEGGRLDAAADDAALSRVYGGIHYRFDGEVGLALGRKVAAWALQHDVVGRQSFVLGCEQTE